MLIEDITIESELIQKSSGTPSSTTPTTTVDTPSGDTSAKVLNVDINFSLNALSEASIAIVLEDNKSIKYLELKEYTRKKFVGQEIKITWKREPNEKDIRLFEGRITGIRLAKSGTSIQYSVKCSGGLLALYNTTVAVAGWFPFGSWDDTNVAEFFEDQITTGQKWKSPKELLKLLGDKLPKARSIRKNKQSQAAQKQLDQVQSEILSDVEKIIEPEILKEFWGNVGKFSDFSIAIRKRISALVTQEQPNVTYWTLLTTLCNEIGLVVVPWINRTLILPKMLFVDSTKTNFLFPSLLKNYSIMSDPFDHPDQIVMITDESSSEGLPATKDITVNGTAIVFPEDSEVDTTDFSPYQGNRYLLVNPFEYRYLMYIYHERLRKYHLEVKKKNQDQSRKSTTDDPAPLKKGLADLKVFCKSYAEYLFREIRAKKDVGSCNLAFQPLLAPGFPCYIIDAKQGMNFRGMITRVGHNISQVSAVTNVSVSFLISLDEEINFKSPLWEKIVPSGGGIGPDALKLALDEIIQGDYDTSIADHIPYTDTLLTEELKEEMEDELKAGIYTGRLKKRKTT